ncbi:MAG: hypothetical protein SVZ03_16175 [Spirochaetota bacterium]|nr:hypothetical protein [Spirochaetota bacterium]
MISLFIILAIMMSCNTKTYEEIEPNDAFSRANRIETNSIVEGLLNTLDDIDFYRLEVITPMVVDVSIAPVKGVNHAFQIWGYDGSHVLMKHVDDLRKSSPERICNLFVNKGVYYITVLHGEMDKVNGNSQNKYKLRLSGREWDNEEHETNDSNKNANLLEVGSEILGYFSPSYNRMNYSENHPLREEDWYYLNVELDSEKPILLNIELSGVPEINSILHFLDFEQDEIGSSDMNGLGQGELLKDIGISISGIYYIMVASNFESNCDVPYRLLVTSRDYDHSSEIEPNNIIDQANVIVGDNVKGRIFPKGDIDYYLYNNISSENKIYKIEVIPPGDLDIKFEIYSSNDKRLFEIDCYAKGVREIMPNALLFSDYYIKVMSKGGEYDHDFPYQVSVSSSPFSEGNEIEPNDKKGLANVIRNDIIKGYISSKGDKDYYYLEYNRRVMKKFTVYGVKDSELKISITDPLGYTIKSEILRGDESKSIIEMIDNKGYVVVESLVENYDGPYKIEIGEK